MFTKIDQESTATSLHCRLLGCILISPGNTARPAGDGGKRRDKVITVEELKSKRAVLELQLAALTPIRPETALQRERVRLACERFGFALQALRTRNPKAEQLVDLALGAEASAKVGGDL